MSLCRAEREQQHSSASPALSGTLAGEVVGLSDEQGAAFLPEGKWHRTTPACSAKPTSGRFQHLPG